MIDSDMPSPRVTVSESLSSRTTHHSNLVHVSK